MLIKQPGNEFQAPAYSNNAIGTPEWSGVRANIFNEKLQAELTLFIVYEAVRQGHNDARYERIEYNNSNMFHHKFLGGWPHKLWNEYYFAGVSEYQDVNIKINQ